MEQERNDVEKVEQDFGQNECRPWSRRHFLKIAGLSAAALGVGAYGLAGCGGEEATTTTGGATTTAGATTTTAAGVTTTTAAGVTTTTGGGVALDYNGKEDLAEQVKAKGSKTVGYVTACGVCALTSKIIDNLEIEADRRGWKVQVADAAGDLSKVPGLIETFIQAKVDFINENAVESGALGDALQKAKDAGIPFFIDNAPWVEGAACSIGQNAFEMGQRQAQWIAARLKGQGNVGILTFSPFTVVARREAVLKTILAQYPGIKIVEDYTVDPTKAIDDCRKTVEAWLIKYPKGQLHAVWGGWDDPASGAATAIDAAGRQDDVFVIGNDCGPDILELMRSGSSFDGDIFIDPRATAVEICHQMDRIVLGMPVESREIFVNQPIISRHLGNVPPKGENPTPPGTYFIWPNKE